MKNLSLGYRISRYTCELKISVVEDPDLQILLEKCVYILDVCMRDNFTDCPDREQGQWIGDVSVQALRCSMWENENAEKLLKKAIHDFIVLRGGDRLVGNVPSCHYGELPSKILNAISEIGMMAEYFAHNPDRELAELCYQPILNYLKLWHMDA